MTTALRNKLMTVEEFLGWTERQSENFELFDGVPIAMSPERVVHGDTKYRVARAFDNAIAKAGVQCRFVLDSAAVKIDARSSYQPDVMVYCGEPAPRSAVLIDSPLIVVEVLSPGNAMKDLRDKLQGYFRVPSIQHYLIVDPDKRIVIYHSRGDDDAVTTRIVSQGHVALDPPGLKVAISDFFEAA